MSQNKPQPLNPQMIRIWTQFTCMQFASNRTFISPLQLLCHSTIKKKIRRQKILTRDILYIASILRLCPPSPQVTWLPRSVYKSEPATPCPKLPQLHQTTPRIASHLGRIPSQPRVVSTTVPVRVETANEVRTGDVVRVLGEHQLPRRIIEPGSEKCPGSHPDQARVKTTLLPTNAAACMNSANSYHLWFSHRWTAVSQRLLHRAKLLCYGTQNGTKSSTVLDMALNPSDTEVVSSG